MKGRHPLLFRLFLVVWFSLVTADLFAEAIQISEHDQQHVAEQAARDALRAEGCAWTKTTRAQRFRLVKDSSSYRVIGNELLIICVEQLPAKTQKISMIWQPPTKRENGQPLQPSEIAGYKVYFDDVFQLITSATSYQAETKTAPKKIGVKTVDAKGLDSIPAEVFL